MKSGWLYERKPGLVFGRRWIPRWVVIYGEPVPAVGVYEQRSDAVPPYAPLRHLDLLSDTQIRSAGDSKPRTMLGWLRRESAAQTTPSASMSELPDGETEQEHIFYISRSGNNSLKLCFATKSRQERDEWVGALRGVLLGATVPTEPTNLNPTPVITASRLEHHDNETIAVSGVVVLEGRAVARIKAGSSSNPLAPRTSSSGDSIVGDVNQSLAVINDPHEERIKAPA